MDALAGQCSVTQLEIPMRQCFNALALSLLLGSTPVLALQTGDLVENFRLVDHSGASHELYRYRDAKAIAFLVQGNGCPIVRNEMPAFKALRDRYAAQGVQFFLLNSNLQDTRESVRREAEEYVYDMPVLMDDNQLIGEALGLTRTGEVFVVNPANWSVAYHGAVDDRLDYEKQKAVASRHFLAEALDDLLAAQPVRTASSPAKGCLINFPEVAARAQHATISYSDTIAPILQKNCVTCHREGGIGPWAMTSYDMVRGFAPMIREVIRTQRMPPWHADPAYGHFVNDRSLQDAEIRQIVHWVEAGAPRGDGADPLANDDRVWPEWSLGKPDVIIDLPPQEIGATGTIEYQYPVIPNPIGRDVWVRAAEILPGDRKALHHVITNFAVPGPDGKFNRRNGGVLGGYVPGGKADVFPTDTGTFLPANAVLRPQMHYTTYGKASVDHSRLGLYFHENKPAHPLKTAILMNNRISIPANTREYWDSAERTIDRDILVYTLLPHAHYRGKASEFVAYYPDGSREVLLSVPNYDFNWQTTYELETPKRLPAGTRIVHRTAWDNSATNPANPDHDRVVPWGEQSWDEMLFGAITYRDLDEPAPGGAVASSGGD
ncbi:MAG: redoxin domain-containing protein [Pseudomonadales bacterium]|nr:redoxin domain-containing protein [Pseudomonadales bacterium]MCP5185044.1 redoxin domain-containing protein [Pseudomonadales bacterium]